MLGDSPFDPDSDREYTHFSKTVKNQVKLEKH